jgi:hypothetical protein
MLPISTLIVDDELQSRSLIRKLLTGHVPDLLINEADSVSSALENKSFRSGSCLPRRSNERKQVLIY